MLLSGHVDGDLVPAAEVAQLTFFNLPAGWVGEVLAQLGLLDDPRGPAIGRWITRQTAQVPAAFAADVRDWLRWLHTGDARPGPAPTAPFTTTSPRSGPTSTNGAALTATCARSPPRGSHRR